MPFAVATTSSRLIGVPDSLRAFKYSFTSQSRSPEVNGLPRFLDSIDVTSGKSPWRLFPWENLGTLSENFAL
jgi:hypothetical protein